MQHEGDTDPVAEGWTHFVTNSGSPGIAAGGRETTPSGEHAYWRVQDLIYDGSQSYNSPLPQPLSIGAWRLTAVVRVVDSPIVPNGGLEVGGTGVFVADGRYYWSFYLSNVAAGPVSNNYNRGGSHSFARSVVLDTRDDYHEYTIQFTPKGGDNDSADFSVDGKLVFDDVPRQGLFESSDSLFYFGPIATNGISDAKYAWVCFESGIGSDMTMAPALEGRWFAGQVWPGLTPQQRHCGSPATPTPTPSATATSLPTPTATASPTQVPTATATTPPSATPSPTPPPTAPPCVPATRASDIALILDRSSSMNAGGKLAAAIAAISQFVDSALAPPDQIALVTFADVAGVNQVLTSDSAALKRVLSGIVTGAGTRIDLGLGSARLELASRRHNVEHAKVMILLSDGVQSSGASDLVLTEADAAKASGAVIFTIALGADADVALLRLIASSPSHAYVAPSGAELSAIYRRIEVAIPCPPTATPGPVTPEPTKTIMPSRTATYVPATATSLPGVPTPILTLTATATPREQPAESLIFLPKLLLGARR